MIHNLNKPETPIWKDLLIIVLFFVALLLFAINTQAQTLTGGKVDISCYGNNDGYIGVTTYPITQCVYKCTNGSVKYCNTSGAFYNLTAGTWIVSSHGYTPISFTIEEPPLLDANVVIEDSCSVWIEVTGGTAIIQPHVFTWKRNGIPFNSDPYSTYETNLLPGNYEVIIEDNNGCSITRFFTIN
jgi:uncharacterized protein (DUF2141 family)